VERCKREGLPVPAKESCVAEILAQDHKATGKTGDDHQRDSYQADKYEWVLPDSGGGSNSQVVDLCVHAKHGDAWQRQHLSGITPVRPPDPETLSGSLTTAHMAATVVFVSDPGSRFWFMPIARITVVTVSDQGDTVTVWGQPEHAPIANDPVGYVFQTKGEDGDAGLALP
jgi:hypothetical protein